MKLSFEQTPRSVPAATTVSSAQGSIDELPKQTKVGGNGAAPSQRPRISRSVLLVTLVGLFAVAAVCFALYKREAGSIEQNVLYRESQRTAIYTRFLEEDMQSVVKDLRQLADGDGLQSFFLSHKQADLDRAIHRARFVSQLNPDYDQVRFIDEQGREILRVNANGDVVPSSRLQNKADRPYFKKTNVLAPGQFYISAFDLNVENGQVQQPPKPMLRIATPVFDSTGRRCGIYIINDLGANIIGRLLQFTPQFQQRLRILNAQGYWLKAAQPDQEWGFMFPEKAGLTLARTDPALWAQISSQTEGQTPHAGGYFTWHRVVPRDAVADMPPGSVVADDDFLVIASEISPEEWAGYFTGLQQTFFVLASVLLLLVLVSGWFFNQRRRAQQERDRFFTMTHDLLCIAGFDGYFKRVNPAWEETLGYTREEMLSKPFQEFLHPDDVAKTLAVFAGQKHGQDVLNFENRYRCKDGSYRWLMWSARQLVDEGLIFASARDLTERKRSEQENIDLNMELNLRAGQLEAANKELEAFSYSVSHDLRAPLRHIHGFVELLQKSPAVKAEESSVRHLQVVARAARDMGLLIDDLLAFSRTGRAEMHLRRVDMSQLVEHSVRELEAETVDRKVAWSIKPLPAVLGRSHPPPPRLDEPHFQRSQVLPPA